MNQYDNFFNSEKRAKKLNEQIDLDIITDQVFKFLYEGDNRDKLYEKKDKKEDVFLFKKLIEKEPFDNKDTNAKITCDLAFLEYLKEFKDSTNPNYFELLLKFTVLFRECFNKSKNKTESESDKIKESTEKPVETKPTETVKEEGDSSTLAPDKLPEMCNEFYSEFLDGNNFFGMSNDDKTEIIEIIQHFCIWLHKKQYTKFKLSLSK